MIPYKFKAFQCQLTRVYMAVPIYGIWHSNSLLNPQDYDMHARGGRLPWICVIHTTK